MERHGFRYGPGLVAAAAVALLLAPAVTRAQETLTYRYDAAGRLVRVESGATRESYGWNTAGGMVRARRETGGISLRVVVVPRDGGTVTGPGIDCPADCVETGTQGFTATLSAVPAPGWRFAGWSGAAAGTGATATVTVHWDTVVRAHFLRDGGETDGDGVDDALEMGPDGDDPGWDGNGDGIPDVIQARVASFPSLDGRYVTLEAPEGITLAHAAAVPNPSPDDAPVDRFPLGFFEMTFSGMVPGSCFTANLWMPGDPELVSYWMYGPTPQDPSDHWWRFDFQNGRGARFHADPDGSMRIALSFCDGLEGDADLTANGVVVDPGGPALNGDPELVVVPRTAWIPGQFDDTFINEFPLTPVGSWSEIEVEIINVGHGAIGIGPLEFLGEPSSNDPTITREEENCSNRTLPAGERCTVRIRFTPNGGFKHMSPLYVMDQNPYNPSVLAQINPSGAETSDPEPDPVDAHLLVQGQGRITSTAPGVDCTGECTVSLAASAFPADFTATPMAGWRFRQWIWRWETLNLGSYEWAALDYRNPVTIRTSSGFLAFPSPMNSNPTGPPSLVAVFEEIPAEHTVTVNRTGAGRGTVVASAAGLVCGGTCSVPVTNGEELTLTASPEPGSVFAGWSGGGCTGTAPCTLTVTAPVTVTAEFGPAPPERVLLTVGAEGAGTVTSSPTGIACPPDCTAEFEPGTAVRLEASPSPGWRLGAWNLAGAVAGTGPLELFLDADRTVTALFEPDLEDRATLTVRACGPGSGKILSSPGGIACAGECSAVFGRGETVVLLADPDPGSAFGGWSGGGCEGAEPCVLALDADTTVAAGFGDGIAVRGDVTGDGEVTAGDDLAVLAWLFTDPTPPGDPPDASWDCRTNAADLAFVVGNRTARDAANTLAWPWLEPPDALLERGVPGRTGPPGETEPSPDEGAGTASGKAPPIPALSGGGILLFVLILLGSGLAVLRR